MAIRTSGSWATWATEIWRSEVRCIRLITRYVDSGKANFNKVLEPMCGSCRIPTDALDLTRPVGEPESTAVLT